LLLWVDLMDVHTTIDKRFSHGVLVRFGTPVKRLD
jgi:hypothetical protein